MAALRSRCGHYIFVLWFLLLSSFFLAYSQQSQIECLPYFHTWCGLSANLGCRSETCCTQLTVGNAGGKNRQNFTIWAPSHNFVALLGHIFATKACIDNRKKNLLSSNTSPTCSYNMVNVGPLAAETVSLVWETPANFNGFRVLAALMHGTLLVGVSQTLRH